MLRKCALVTTFGMLVLGQSVAIAAEAQEAANLCRNPGFELLNPAGDNFPVDWGGAYNVTIHQDAHSGSVALRLASATNDRAGVNSSEIKIRRGKITYFYKAISSKAGGENLKMFAIGVQPGHQEVTRVGLAVPAHHVGDEQWHQAALQFDFSTISAVEGILIAPRVNENSPTAQGEWLVDDIVCVQDRIGPRAGIEAIYMADPILQIGKPRELVLAVANTGDEPVPASKIRLVCTGPAEILGAQQFSMDALAPGQAKRFTWSVSGKSKGNVQLQAQWSAAEFAPNTILEANYPTICTDSADPRSICTTIGGFWRFMPEPMALQADNDAPLKPFVAKKSRELPDNMFGITAHVPRGKDLEIIFEPEHLIDGDYKTNWSARAHQTPCPGSTDWVQVDLPATSLKEVRLVPYYRAEGFPIDFVVKVRTGREWKTVQDVQNVRLSSVAGEGDKQPYRIELPQAVHADAIRVETTRFSVTSNFFTEFGLAYYFRLSEIEAIDANGRNVARSPQAKATASTTWHTYYNTREVVEKTLPELFNIGVKWNRIGQWGDLTCWAAVEREKGKYELDARTEQGINEMIDNGVNVLYTLCYGNPLYEETKWQSNPGPQWRHGHPFTGDGGPTKPDAIEGFVNYAKFVANKFKGRVKYYEVWNEENSWGWYGSPPDPKAFGTLVRRTAEALKRIDPEIKVSTGGTAALAPTFISEALKQGGAGPLIDAVAFHPYTMPCPEMGLGALDVIDGQQKSVTPAELGYKTWEEMLTFLRGKFAPYQPKLELWANEWNAIPDRQDSLKFGQGEITEAKHAARFFLMCTLTDVHAIWWSLANENYHFDWAVLRTGDLSRKPVYYTMQAMCTLLSGAKRDDSIGIEIIGNVPELRRHALRRGDDVLVAVWSAIQPKEDGESYRVDLHIKADAVGHGPLQAVDTLHGVVQDLKTVDEGGYRVVKGLLVSDCPVIVQTAGR